MSTSDVTESSSVAGARSAIADEPWLATQLCPTDARRFFPAFDEPGIKARYRVSVTAPADLAVISNAPVESQDAVADGRRTWHFEPTPPLSSYLLAVAVGPFEASPALRVGTTEIRVHTLPGPSGCPCLLRQHSGSVSMQLMSGRQHASGGAQNDPGPIGKPPDRKQHCGSRSAQSPFS